MTSIDIVRLRLISQHSTAAAIEQDFNEGKILRTHVLRPTWHFISPEDIRWMLKLSAPKVINTGTMCWTLNLPHPVFTVSSLSYYTIIRLRAPGSE